MGFLLPRKMIYAYWISTKLDPLVSKNCRLIPSIRKIFYTVVLLWWICFKKLSSHTKMEILKQRYFGAFQEQERVIGKKFEKIFENTKKIDFLVNNVACKNEGITTTLKPIIQNMFVVYQKEIIELLIDDLLQEEVKFPKNRKKSSKNLKKSQNSSKWFESCSFGLKLGGHWAKLIWETTGIHPRDMFPRIELESKQYTDSKREPQVSCLRSWAGVIPQTVFALKGSWLCKRRYP